MNDFCFNEKNAEPRIKLMICGFTPAYREMLSLLFSDKLIISDSDPHVIIAEEGTDIKSSAVPIFILGSEEGRRKNRILIRRPPLLSKLRADVLSAVSAISSQTEAEPRLIVNSRKLTVSLGAATAHLTSMEFALFNLLYQRKGIVVSREDINRALWQESDGSNVCDVYICYLRKKLEPLMGSGVIISLRGKGYMLKLPSVNSYADA